MSIFRKHFYFDCKSASECCWSLEAVGPDLWIANALIGGFIIDRAGVNFALGGTLFWLAKAAGEYVLPFGDFRQWNLLCGTREKLSAVNLIFYCIADVQLRA